MAHPAKGGQQDRAEPPVLGSVREGRLAELPLETEVPPLGAFTRNPRGPLATLVRSPDR